jgi:hypothetical protein
MAHRDGSNASYALRKLCFLYDRYSEEQPLETDRTAARRARSAR